MLESIAWLFDGSEHTLRLWEVTGTWISSLGTIAAVIAALYLGLRGEKISLKVSAVVMEEVGGPNPAKEYLVVTITNTALRPVSIVALGWNAGWLNWGPLKRKYFYQLNSTHPSNSNLPTELKDGEEAKYFLNPKQLLEHFAKDLPNSAYRKSLRFLVYPTHSKPFSAAPLNFIERLIKQPYSQVDRQNDHTANGSGEEARDDQR
ncbi:hypothetical protein HYPP_02389 [Hyphomicrobium sp. ghe19]|nr:hypothetical protein HYPP_02389 [Hyphomicrobium sp. ghe19]